MGDEVCWFCGQRPVQNGCEVVLVGSKHVAGSGSFVATKDLPPLAIPRCHWCKRRTWWIAYRGLFVAVPIIIALMLPAPLGIMLGQPWPLLGAACIVASIVWAVLYIRKQRRGDPKSPENAGGQHPLVQERMAEGYRFRVKAR